jgi:hypothetical protein
MKSYSKVFNAKIEMNRSSKNDSNSNLSAGE